MTCQTKAARPFGALSCTEGGALARESSSSMRSLRFVRPQAATKVFRNFGLPFTFPYNMLNNSMKKQVKGNFVLSLFDLFKILI